MKCFYHNDMDGKCAGAIVYKYYKVDRDFYDEIGEDCEFISINYNQDFPFETIRKDEAIIIVDFSLQKDGDFDKLLSITDNVLWIDHHKSAIEKHEHLSDKVRGVRKDGISGCELTWNFFYPRDKMPKMVEMLGCYDVWDFSAYGDDLNKIQTGTRLYNTKPESSIWYSWLSTGEFELDRIAEVLHKGTTALAYRDSVNASMIKSWSWYTSFEGYRAIVCNQGSTSSQLFDTVDPDTYDIMMPFIFDGKQWTVSIYTKRDDIDVSEIAARYGGGGHKKAAGFQCAKLPFNLLK